MIEKQTTNITTLKAPQLTQENLITVVTKVQPFRKGGLRVQHEEINGKHIFHNYGHGSSGISLAYGSAFISVKSLSVFVQSDRPVQCAVIGSGLIALLTAIELSKIGHIVTIYAERFATYGEKDYSKKLASQVDEGVWLPFGYDMTDKFKHQLFGLISFNYYKSCLKVGRYQSFKVATIYERDATIQELKEKIPPFLYNGYKKQTVQFGNGKTEDYIRFKTFKIDTELWLEELRIEADLRGIKFVTTKFNNVDDVLKLKEDSIFNCTGYASKTLFNDQNLTGTTDHLIIFKNTTQSDYSISGKIRDNLNFRVHCFRDKVILRSETSIENSNQNFAKNLIKETQAFFQSRSIKAKI